MQEYKVVKGIISSITYSDQVPYITITIKDDYDRYIKCYIDEHLFFQRSNTPMIRTAFYSGNERHLLNPTPVGKYCVGVYDEESNRDTMSFTLDDITIDSMLFANSTIAKRNIPLQHIHKAVKFVPDCMTVLEGVVTVNAHKDKTKINMSVIDMTDIVKHKLFDAIQEGVSVLFFIDYDDMCRKIICEKRKDK